MLPVNGSELRRDRRGGGELVEVLAKTDFAFDGRAGGTDQVVPLAVGIDTYGWRSGVVIVRLHAIGTWSATAVAVIQRINVSLVPEDPSVIFTNGIILVADGSGAPADVRILPTSLPGQLIMKEFGKTVGPQLKLELLWLQGATPGTTQTFSMSVDLVGRYR